jgi:chemotaxis protein methyltransferase CheR
VSILPEPYFTELSHLLQQATGIYFDASKKYFLEARVQLRMRTLGIASLEEYVRYLRQGAHRAQELKQLQELVAVHETYFFRHPQQMDLLRQEVFPRWGERIRRPGARVRIWSSGCSSGEEPYSIAILLVEHFGYELVRDRFELLATDLSEAILHKARRAIYGPASFRGHMPEAYLGRYFRTHRQGRALCEEIRSLVRFQTLNLKDSLWPIGAGWDLILCRNVLIYFDAPTKQHILRRFFDLLLPGGYLALGESESLYGYTDDFRVISGKGAMLYQRPQATGGEQR